MGREVKGKLPCLTTNRHGHGRCAFTMGGRRQTSPSNVTVQGQIWILGVQVEVTSKTIRYRSGTSQNKRRRNYRRGGR